MNEKSTTNRLALAKVAALVRPALATQDYIKALTHIKFDGEYATSHNDISAISIRCQVAVDRCIPGELLIKALGSFGAEQIMFQDGKNGALVLSSGRSKLTLPTLAAKDFPFDWPSDEDGTEVDLDHAILKGIERCLLSVGTDPTHASQMGVTLDADDRGHAVLFSTDNFSMSRYQTKTKVKLPGDVPVILPRFFCEQLVSLSKAYPDDDMVLVLHDGALLVEFGKAAKLFTKTPVDLQPLDFPSMFLKYVKLDGIKNKLSVIPDSFDAAFGRALLVLSGEVDKATKVTVDGDSIKLSSTSSLGDSDDSMSFDGSELDAFHTDPVMIARAVKACALLGFTPKVTILADADANFVHLVAHCAA
jgi:DNA polymerase III sliding clamp (beta) subunit (PCNA family)